MKYPATKEQIKRAFHKLAHVHHPDKGGDEGKFKEINEAYQMLISRGYWFVMSEAKAKRPEQASDPLWKPVIYFAEDGSAFWTEDADGMVVTYYGALSDEQRNEEIKYKQ